MKLRYKGSIIISGVSLDYRRPFICEPVVLKFAYFMKFWKRNTFCSGNISISALVVEQIEFSVIIFLEISKYCFRILATFITKQRFLTFCTNFCFHFICDLQVLN